MLKIKFVFPDLYMVSNKIFVMIKSSNNQINKKH